jgi:hypothetical protein
MAGPAAQLRAGGWVVTAGGDPRWHSRPAGANNHHVSNCMHSAIVNRNRSPGPRLALLSIWLEPGLLTQAQREISTLRLQQTV